MKEELAMSQCEKTENQAEQNKSHAVAGIEAYPTPPHGCFFRNDRCNLAHADLQCGVTGLEVWPPECIDEVDHSESKANARTKNHENLCGQDALPYFVGLTPRLNRRAAPEEVAGRLEPCGSRCLSSVFPSVIVIPIPSSPYGDAPPETAQSSLY